MGKKKRNSLDPSKAPKQRRFYIDYDYADKLDDESLEFLKTFTDEFYGGSFKINPTYILDNGDYIQVSENKDKSKNIDLRTIPKVQKYYKDDKGKFTKDSSFKYRDDIHKNTKDKRALWRDNWNRNMDVVSHGFKRDNEDNTLHLDLLEYVEAFPDELGAFRADIITALNILNINYDHDMSDIDLISFIGKLSAKKIDLLRVEIKELLYVVDQFQNR